MRKGDHRLGEAPWWCAGGGGHGRRGLEEERSEGIGRGQTRAGMWWHDKAVGGGRRPAVGRRRRRRGGSRRARGEQGELGAAARVF